MPHEKKRRNAEGFATTMPESCTASQEYEGVNGYFYSVEYSEGYVRLALYASVDAGLTSEAKTGCTIAVKDWKLFWSVVCPDLDNPGFPEIVNVSQWDSNKGHKIYRVHADRFIRPPEDFIFLSVCEDREKVMAARGREEWKLKPYPISNQEYDMWFKNVFFIQWCDWMILEKMFEAVDYAIKRDRIRLS